MKKTLLTLALASVLIIGTVGAGLLLLPTDAPVSASLAEGDSMGHSGQTVVVHADVGDYAVGDAVVFSAGDDVFHHRIVDSASDGYVTQGDTEPVTDQAAAPGIEPVSESQIHGEALVSVPSGVVLGGLLAALGMLAGTAAWFWRHEVASGLHRGLGAARTTASAVTGRQIGTVVVVLLLVVSGAGPLVGTMPQEHDGVASADTASGDVVYGAGGYQSQKVKALDADTGDQIWSTSLSNSVMDVAVSPDETIVYAAVSNGDVVALNASDGSQLWLNNPSIDTAEGLSLSHDNETLVVGGSPSDVVGLDTDNGSQLWHSTPHSDIVNSVSVSPDDSTVYSASKDNTVKALEMGTGDVLWTTTAHTNRVRSVSSSPSGGTVYSADYDGNVIATDAETGDTTWNRTVHSGRAHSVRPGPNGPRVYSGGSDNYVRALDAGTGDELWNTSSHSDTIKGVSASPDGSVTYSASHDNTVKAYDSDTGDILWTSTAFSGYVYAVAGGSEQSTTLESVNVSVTDSDGNALENTTVEAVNTSTGNTAASGTTDASGAVELTVDAGEYDITASHPDEPTVTKTVDVPSGGTSVDFVLKEPDDGTYEQTFVLDDQTADQRFSDAGLTIQRETESMGPGTIVTTDDWTTIDQTTFNHNDRAWSSLENGTYYRLKLTDDFSAWTYNGFHAIEDNGAFYLRPGRIQNATNDTDLNTTSDNITVVSGDDGIVIEYDGEPVDTIDYNISDPETGEYVEGDIDFEEPTDYYEGNFDDDILTNNTTSEPDFDEWEADYEGVYSNGSRFNGSVQATSLDGYSLDTRNGSEDETGGFAAPAGGSSGGTPTWVIGIPAVAAVGFVVLRRRGVV